MGAILLFILKNPVQVCSLIQTVIELVNEGVTWVDIQRRLGAFDKAAKNAETSKDTSELEDVFNTKSDT